MCKRLYLFSENQNFFYKQQFVFRKNHSTTYALSIFVNKVTEFITNKKSTLGISKALIYY